MRPLRRCLQGPQYALHEAGLEGKGDYHHQGPERLENSRRAIQPTGLVCVTQYNVTGNRGVNLISMLFITLGSIHEYRTLIQQRLWGTRMMYLERAVIAFQECFSKIYPENRGIKSVGGRWRVEAVCRGIPPCSHQVDWPRHAGTAIVKPRWISYIAELRLVALNTCLND